MPRRLQKAQHAADVVAVPPAPRGQGRRPLSGVPKGFRFTSMRGDTAGRGPAWAKAWRHEHKHHPYCATYWTWLPSPATFHPTLRHTAGALVVVDSR